MQLGICALPEAVSRLVEVPFDFVEVNVLKFLNTEDPDSDFDAVMEMARACPRPISCANCFLPGYLKVVGPEVDLARLESYASIVFARARSVGVELMVFGSGEARRIPDGWSSATAFEQLIEVLRRLGTLAQAHGITLVIEPLRREECNLVNTILEGAVAVARVGHPNVRLLVDFYHMAHNGELPEDIVKVAPWIAHAHVAEKSVRSAPGTHGDDFRPYLRALKQAGYAGRLSIEVWWSDMAVQVPPALAELRKQLADVGYQM